MRRHCCWNKWYWKCKSCNGSIGADMHDVILEVTCFIAACYGKWGWTHVKCNIWCLADKNEKEVSSLNAKTSNFASRTESVVENAKQARLQACVWRSEMDQDPLHGSNYVWIEQRLLIPTTNLNFKPPAPTYVLHLICCSCSFMHNVLLIQTSKRLSKSTDKRHRRTTLWWWR